MSESDLLLKNWLALNNKQSIDLFWSNVDKSGSCWLWTASKDVYGYGRFRLRKSHSDTRIKSHRIAYCLSKGFIDSTVCVLHSCDTPPCCNPDHLSAGTQSDNSNDMVAKKRYSFGEQYPKSKLTEESALEILKLKAANISPYVIAKMYGVSPTTVYHVGVKNWKHLVS